MIFKIIKAVFVLSLAFSIFVLSTVGIFNYVLPSDFNTIKGSELEFGNNMPINAVKNDVLSEDEYSVTLKFLGLIPVSEAKVKVLDDYTVNVLGTPFGIKIYTDGVMVVGITDVDSKNGAYSPAKMCGLRLGDLITSINGVSVFTNEEVASIIEQSNGKTLKLAIIRDNKKIAINITPVLSVSSNKYKAGMWVRDSSAGIGTNTFYCPSLNITAGLGHGVCDVDTGELLTISSGETVKASILDIDKSTVGSPGELKGQFLNESLGKIITNNETGIFYENTNKSSFNNLKKIALKQEIKAGEAKIYTCIDGNTPKYYNCEIEKINYNNSVTKNMVIKITDKELLDKTGGIVQGMSGSPIIQNNKLVGAVTHVFVNDPSKGYGIFAENMLKTAQNSESKLNKVS